MPTENKKIKKSDQLLSEIRILRREVELQRRDNYKKIIRTALYGLLLAFLALLVCFIVLAFMVQNFKDWKYDIEISTEEQRELSKETVKVIKDMSWIHLQRLMIEETIKISKTQIEDLRKLKKFTENLKSYQEWEKKHGKKRIGNDSRRHPKTN